MRDFDDPQVADKLIRVIDSIKSGDDIHSAADDADLNPKIAMSFLDNIKQGRTKDLLEKVQHEPPKVLLWNYRIESLPYPLRRFFMMHYYAVSGVVRVYAPYVEKRKFWIAYGGKYRLVSGAPVIIDERKVAPNQEVRLRRGIHEASRASFRLVWSPPRKRIAVARDVPPGGKKLFEAIYTY